MNINGSCKQENRKQYEVEYEYEQNHQAAEEVFTFIFDEIQNIIQSKQSNIYTIDKVSQNTV